MRITAEESRQLVERVQANDPDAFAQLYRQYRPEVLYYIRARVYNPHTAEDLTHDVFVRALRHIDFWTWRGANVGAWLQTIARNIVIDHVISRKRRRELVSGFDQTADGDRPDDSPDADLESVAVRQDRAAILHAAMQHLTPEQREVLTLRFMHDKSITETAEAMGRDEPAVKSMQHRAVRALRRNKHIQAVAA